MKYLFFDIDSTLLSHTEGISLSTIEALRLAKENGHKIFICTGRSFAEIPDSFDKFEFDGVIAAAGGYVKVGDQVIFNKVMPEHLVDNITYIMDRMGLHYILEGIEKSYADKTIIIERDKIAKEVKEKKDSTGYEHAAYYYGIPEMYTIADYFKDRTNISKATVYAHDKEELLELKKYIDKDFDLINYGVNGELIAKGLNKYTGIQEVLAHYGADEEDTFAIGDSLNDYDMVHYAQIGVAMGNASEPLKEVADYITTDVDDNGVYNALRHFDLI